MFEPHFADVEDDPTGGMMNSAKPMLTKMILSEEDIGKEFYGEKVGTDKSPCTWWAYPENRKLSEIDIYTDGTKLRRMTMMFLDGGYRDFGDESFDSEPLKYDFSGKVDLLGVFGMVTPAEENDNSKAHIHSLGFITNSCPVRDLLDYESNHKVTKLSQLEKAERVAIEEAANFTLLITIVGVCLGCMTLCACYFLLKNRGTICKKKKKADDKREVSMPVPQDTP